MESLSKLFNKSKDDNGDEPIEILDVSYFLPTVDISIPQADFSLSESGINTLALSQNESLNSLVETSKEVSTNNITGNSSYDTLDKVNSNVDVDRDILNKSKELLSEDVVKNEKSSSFLRKIKGLFCDESPYNRIEEEKSQSDPTFNLISNALIGNIYKNHYFGKIFDVDLLTKLYLASIKDCEPSQDLIERTFKTGLLLSFSLWRNPEKSRPQSFDHVMVIYKDTVTHSLGLKDTYSWTVDESSDKFGFRLPNKNSVAVAWMPYPKIEDIKSIIAMPCFDYISNEGRSTSFFNKVNFFRNDYLWQLTLIESNLNSLRESVKEFNNVKLNSSNSKPEFKSYTNQAKDFTEQNVSPKISDNENKSEKKELLSIKEDFLSESWNLLTPHRCNEIYSFFDTPLDILDSKLRNEIKAAGGRRISKRYRIFAETIHPISSDCKMSALIKYCQDCEKELRLRPVQIQIHSEELHWRNSQNLEAPVHCHIIWIIYDENGKRIKLSKPEFSKFHWLFSSNQDLVGTAYKFDDNNCL